MALLIPATTADSSIDVVVNYKYEPFNEMDNLNWAGL